MSGATPRADTRSEVAAPLLLRGGEVAQLLGIGRSTAFELMASGELPVVRIGRAVRVPRYALQRWIEERVEPFL